MKNLKKIASLVLALVMVFSLATTAFAAGESEEEDKEVTYTLTLNNAIEDHTYTAYQIFTGDLNDDGVLSNIVWGSGVTSEGQTYFGDAETKAKALTTTADAEAFAAQVAAYLGTIAGEATVETDATTCKIDGLAAGYYLIRNNTAPEDGAYTDYIMVVVKDTEANVKAGVPTGGKEITADDNKIDGDIAPDGESNNVSIGSKVTYTLTGTIPDEASYYDYYYFIFNDTLSKGLTFNNDVVVTIGGNDAANKTDYEVYVDGQNIKIALLDAKANAGKEVKVIYTATLNENAVIGGEDGNTNTMKISYSNDPTKVYNGTQDTSKPGLPDSGKDVPTGDTPEDTVRTYTTGLKLIKVDENGKTLTGASFEIKGDNLVEILTVESVTYKADTNGSYWKLQDESYTTEAPITAAYMKVKTTRDNGYVETTDTTREGYTTVDGKGYAPATAEELDGTATLYKLIESNVELYDSIENKYAIETVTYSQKNPVTGQTYTQEVGADGTLILAGLGEGTYNITETATPSGYNSLSGPIEVTIEWIAPTNEDNGDKNCDWTATYKYENTIKTLDLNEGGIFELEIENRSGSTLPSTGGIGTTLFYVFGGILVAAAVVLLVTKKRMSTAE